MIETCYRYDSNLPALQKQDIKLNNSATSRRSSEEERLKTRLLHHDPKVRIRDGYPLITGRT